MGNCCCKRQVDVDYFADDYFADHCKRCRRKGTNVHATKKCIDCDDLLCKTCAGKHTHCCCSSCCYKCEEKCCFCCFPCCCKPSKGHRIIDPPKKPAPTKQSIGVSPFPVKSPTPPPVLPSPAPVLTRKLSAVEKITFKVDGEECWVKAYDVLPNGKFVVADARRYRIYIFSPEYRKLCEMYEKSILDVAALGNYKLAFINGYQSVYFVEIGQRYRHMEITNEIRSRLFCHRIYCFGETIFLTCKQNEFDITENSIVLLNFGGEEILQIPCSDFCINSLTYSNKNNVVFVTDISKGVRAYDLEANLIGIYRDVDVQWYYGIAADREGSVLICTQDELGPELYELELETNEKFSITGMKLLVMNDKTLEDATTIRYNQSLKGFVVGSFKVGYDKQLYGDNFPKDFVSHRVLGLDVALEPDKTEIYTRLRHAQMNSACHCSALDVYKFAVSSEAPEPVALSPHLPLNPFRGRNPEKLVEAGKMVFVAQDKECSVSGYDVLPNGNVLIADRKLRLYHDKQCENISIFSPENIFLCKLRVRTVLDVAALNNHLLVFVYGDSNIIFVLVGHRYRHMEIVNFASTKGRCFRVRYLGEQLYILCRDDTTQTRFINILSKDGQEIRMVSLGNFPANYMSVNEAKILVTAVSEGIRIYGQDGDFLDKYRDIDVQWYYAALFDKYGNIFLCTQDEFGPELYEVVGGTNGNLVKGLFIRLSAREGLDAPLMLCYNPQRDLLVVGSIHADEQEKRLDQYRPARTKSAELRSCRRVESVDPYIVEKQAREKHALEQKSWNYTTCDLYKIEYVNTRSEKYVRNGYSQDSLYLS